MNTTVADADLMPEALLKRLYAVPPADRGSAYWVMSKSTAERIADLSGLWPEGGRSAIHRGVVHLFGHPVQYDAEFDGLDLRISDGPSYTPVREDEVAVYRTCIDPDCSNRKPGFEHAHLTVERDVR